MKKLPLDLYREWENHPITKELQRIFKETVEQDSSYFFDNLKSTDDPNDIAIRAGEIRGRNKVMKKFYEMHPDGELQMKYWILDSEIDWEK